MTFNIKTLADGINNALYLYGYNIRANYLGCDNLLPEKLKELSEDELWERYDETKKFYRAIIQLEKAGYQEIKIDEGGQIYANIGVEEV